MGKKTKPATLADTIRDAIERSDLTRYRIAQETGLSEALLSRFVHGECNMSMASAQMVLDVLELRVDLKRRRVK